MNKKPSAVRGAPTNHSVNWLRILLGVDIQRDRVTVYKHWYRPWRSVLASLTPFAIMGLTANIQVEDTDAMISLYSPGDTEDTLRQKSTDTCYDPLF